MPFVKRNIHPTALSKKPLSSNLFGEFDAVSNTALTNVLRQLGSLMQHASEIFQDLEYECVQTFTRSQQIKAKIWALEEKVDTLDYKHEKIRAIDLKAFEKITDHYERLQVSESCHFSAESRPKEVVCLYADAGLTPVALIKRFDADVEENEILPSVKFHLMPTVSQPYTGLQEDSYFEKSHSHIFAEREYRQSKVRRRPQSACSYQSDIDVSSQKESVLPTPEDLVLKNALSMPSCVVEVDTAGTGFERMCSLRRSQRESMYGSLPTLKRRQTFSGAPEDFTLKRNTPCACSVRNRPWTLPHESRTVSNPAVAEGVNMEASYETSRKFDAPPVQKKEKRMSKLRRALSFTKLKTKSVENLPPAADVVIPTPVKQTEKKSKRFSWLPNFLRKSKKDLSVPRSKSTNFREMSPELDKSQYQSQQNLDNVRMDPMQYKISKRFAFSVPDISDAEDMPVRQLAASPLAARHKSKTPDPEYAIPHATAGRMHSNQAARVAQHRQSILPITQSKLLDTAVTLRENKSMVKREDRHSSSGNWSGSSASTIQSVESDLQKQAEVSRVSVDSGLSPSRSSSTSERYPSVSENNNAGKSEIIKESPYHYKKNVTHLDTDSWLKTLEGKLTQNNLRFHNSVNGDFKMADEDEDSSTYSEDADGFFTSMHLDSGLKRSHSAHLTSSGKNKELSEEPRRCVSAQIFDKKKKEIYVAGSYSGSENISSQSASTTSNTSIDSVIYVPLCKSANTSNNIKNSPQIERKTEIKYIDDANFHDDAVKEYMPSNKSKAVQEVISLEVDPNKEKHKKSKPPPPARKCSLQNTAVNKNILATCQKNNESSNGESHEVVYARIKSKTLINASKFPSTVSISPDHSDDESKAVNRPSSTDNILKFDNGYQYSDENGKDFDEYSKSMPRRPKKHNHYKNLSNSWPRQPKKNTRPGILKSSDRENNGIRQSKTLNFAAHVNVYERTPPTSPEMNMHIRKNTSNASEIPCQMYDAEGGYSYMPGAKPMKLSVTHAEPCVIQEKVYYASTAINNKDTVTVLTNDKQGYHQNVISNVNNQYISMTGDHVKSTSKVGRSVSLSVPRTVSGHSVTGGDIKRSLSEHDHIRNSQESVSSAGRSSTSSGTLRDEVFGSSELIVGNLSRSSSGDSFSRQRSRQHSTSPYNSLTRKKSSSSPIPEDLPVKYMPTITVKAGSNKGQHSEHTRVMPMYANPSQMSSSKSNESLSSTTSGLSTSSGSTQTSGIVAPRSHRSNSFNVRSNSLLVPPLQRPVSEYIPKSQSHEEIHQIPESSKSTENVNSTSSNVVKDIKDCLSSKEKLDNKSYYEKVYGSYVPPFLQRSTSEHHSLKRSSYGSSDSGVGDDKSNGHPFQRSVSEHTELKMMPGIYQNSRENRDSSGSITVAVDVHNSLTHECNILSVPHGSNGESVYVLPDKQTNTNEQISICENKYKSRAAVSKIPVKVHAQNKKNIQNSFIVNESSVDNTESAEMSNVKTNTPDTAKKCLTNTGSSNSNPGLNSVMLPHVCNGDTNSKLPSHACIGQSCSAIGFGYKRYGSLTRTKPNGNDKLNQ